MTSPKAIHRPHSVSASGCALALDISEHGLVYGSPISQRAVPGCADRPYPQLRSAPVRDDVVDVLVVAQAQGGAAHQGAHVQGQDGDEQRLSAFQVTVQ